MVLAPEEVVEAHLVQAGGRGVRRQVAAEAREPVVGPQDHRHRVPADEPPDAPLQRLVAREPRLLLGADRVDVAGLREGRDADVALAGPLQQLVHQEPGAVLALLVQDLVQRVEPLAGLDLVDVGQLLLEVVDVHRGSVGAWAALARAAIRVAPMDAACGIGWVAICRARQLPRGARRGAIRARKGPQSEHAAATRAPPCTCGSLRPRQGRSNDHSCANHSLLRSDPPGIDSRCRSVRIGGLTRGHQDHGRRTRWLLSERRRGRPREASAPWLVEGPHEARP